MNLVYIHLGNDTFPEYIFNNLKQARRFYDGNIFVVVPYKVKQENSLRLYNYGCSITIAEDLKDHPKNVLFEQSSFDYLLTDGYWKYALQRFFYLEAVTEMFSLTNVVHVENDVIIYRNLFELEAPLEKLYPKAVAVNPVGPKDGAGAFIYSHSLEGLSRLNDLHIESVKRGVEALKEDLGLDFITDMGFFRWFHDVHPNIVQYLPLFPEGDFSENSTALDSIFDGASWGQYIGGTPSQGPGVMFEHHWVGQALRASKYQTTWKTDLKGRRIPYVVSKATGKEIRLGNLHIHCKRIPEFV
jgi:hypothetical protein